MDAKSTFVKAPALAGAAARAKSGSVRNVSFADNSPEEKGRDNVLHLKGFPFAMTGKDLMEDADIILVPVMLDDNGNKLKYTLKAKGGSKTV